MSTMPSYTIYQLSQLLNAELEARDLAPIKSQMMYSYANAKHPQFETFESREHDGQTRVTDEEARRFITKFVKNRLSGEKSSNGVERLVGLEID